MCRKAVNQIKLNKKVIQHFYFNISHFTCIPTTSSLYDRPTPILSSCSYVACRHSWVCALNLFRSVCGFLLQQLFNYVWKWNTLKNIIIDAQQFQRHLTVLSDVVLRSLFLIDAILLNDRSPEQFDNIIDMYCNFYIGKGGLEVFCVQWHGQWRRCVWHRLDVAKSMKTKSIIKLFSSANLPGCKSPLYIFAIETACYLIWSALISLKSMTTLNTLRTSPSASILCRNEYINWLIITITVSIRNVSFSSNTVSAACPSSKRRAR